MIHLFGGIRIEGPEHSQPILTLPAKAILANLLLREGKAIARLELAEQIWPGTPIETATNRLRTALVSIRKAIPTDSIITSNTEIRIARVESDLEAAISLRKRSRMAESAEEEIGLLQRLMEIIGQPLAPEIKAGWIDEFRVYWQNHCIAARLRIADLASEAQRFQLAFDQAQAILQQDQFHEGAWAVYLQVSPELDRERDAMAYFTEARRQLRLNHEDDFSAELRDIVRRMNAGQIHRRGQTYAPSDSLKNLAGILLENQLADNPALLLPLLSSQTFIRQAYQKPFESWKLLKRAIESTEGIGADRILAMLVAAKLAKMLDEVSYVIDSTDWLIDHLPESRPEHAYALSLRGQVSMEIGDFAEGEADLRRYVHLSERYGSDSDKAVARIVMGIVSMHRMLFDEAEEVFIEGLESLPADGPLKDVHNRAIILAMLAQLNWLRGTWEQARAWASQSVALASAHRLHFVLCEANLLLGVSEVFEGSGEGFITIATSLAQTYRSRYRYAALSALDLAVFALAHYGEQEKAAIVLAASNQFRADKGFDRPPAAQEFEQRITRLIGSQITAIPAPQAQKLGELVAWVCDLLESI